MPGLYQADPEQGQGPGKALLEGNEGAPGLSSSVKVGQETNGQVPGWTLRLGQVWRAVPGPRAEPGRAVPGRVPQGLQG